jgi:hypothetical protein
VLSFEFACVAFKLVMNRHCHFRLKTAPIKDWGGFLLRNNCAHIAEVALNNCAFLALKI